MSDTKKRLDALNSRISEDWKASGFQPKRTLTPPKKDVPATGTQKRLNDLNSRISDDWRKMDFEPKKPTPAAPRRTEPRLPPKAVPNPRPRVEAPRVEAPKRGTSLAEQYSQGYRSPPGQPKAAVPKPKARPRQATYTIKSGDNPTKIASALGLTLKELEARNPGILKKARRLKIGATINT